MKEILLSTLVLGGSFSLFAYENPEYQIEEQEFIEENQAEVAQSRCRRCYCRYRYWRENPYKEKEFHSVDWAGRRDDELSDQLSR